MPLISPHLAQHTPLAQGSPLRTWVDGWLDYLSDHLPTIFIVVAVLVGILLLVRSGIKQTVLFAVGAALAFLLLTNLEETAAFFEEELPLPPGSSVPPADAPEPTPS